MKAFPIYTNHNDLWAHLSDEHDHRPQEEQDAELDHAAMHRPGSVFGDSRHIHINNPNRCTFPGCTGVFDAEDAGRIAAGGSTLTGWRFAEDEDEDIPAHDHIRRSNSGEATLRALAEYVQVLWQGGHLDRLGKAQQIELESLLDAAGYGWDAESKAGA